MSFKKYTQFLMEKKKKDSKDIEDAKPEIPPVDPSLPLTCPKCGESSKICDCYVNDYYNAKTPQYTPKAKVTKQKQNEEE